MPDESENFEYIVVGSGAGGGPLAARLALAGRRVLLIEAGADHTDEEPTSPSREVSQVPALHGRCSEHPELSWEFFVDHYDDPPAGPDPKRVQDPNHPGDGRIFYPRAAALGGCTAHHAMITIAGPDSDWDDLADFVKDESWRAETMRPYFQRLERNEYLPEPKPVPRGIGRVWEGLEYLFGRTPDHTQGRHGFGGWLRTSVTDLSIGLHDKQLIKVLKGALKQSKRAGLDRARTFVRRFFKGQIRQALDPNHARTQAVSPEGLVLIPLAVCGEKTTIHKNSATPWVQRGRRSTPREFLAEVRGVAGDNLTIWTDTLVTEVTFEDASNGKPRATGVKFLRGAKLYRAHPDPSKKKGAPGAVRASREVILCGGSFNTPQLLMLSGIGEKAHLKRHRIDCRVDLPGVGRNLQDRYEVTVISEMKKEFSLLDHATFDLPDDPGRPDPHLAEWRAEGTGLYTSNGAVLGIFKRSSPHLPQPDLFIFGIPAPFRGYEPGYSKVGDLHNFFTWAILKARTRNTDGLVRLRSADPLDPPDINFHYFNERSRPGRSDDDPDLLAIVDGVKFVRGIARRAGSVIETEDHPGFRDVPEGSDEQIKNWIRRDAWGHHACGTCRMGPDGDGEAVLDSRFRVRGVEGLRVVDASIFPRIPGYFIVTNIYMASERAADVILEDAAAAASS